MKLKHIILVLLGSALFIGCTPTPNSTLTTATIKKNIVGTWHSKSTHRTRDAVTIRSSSTDTFYRNGTLLSTEYLTYIGKRGKILGKMRYKRYFKWKVYGNMVRTTFRSCNSRILKRPRNSKVGFVTDILKAACKYANRTPGRTSKSEKIYYISKHKLIVRGKALYR